MENVPVVLDVGQYDGLQFKKSSLYKLDFFLDFAAPTTLPYSPQLYVAIKNQLLPRRWARDSIG